MTACKSASRYQGTRKPRCNSGAGCDECNRKYRIGLWLKALRSGKFEQCTDYLSADGGFCCLGVLCEVAMQNGAALTKVEGNLNNQTTKYNGEIYELPITVRDWVSLDSINPRVMFQGESQRLSDLNDEKQLSFKQIANVIEKQILNRKESN